MARQDRIKAIPECRERDSPRVIRLNFAWTTLGHAVYGLCQWGAVVVLARELDASAVGEWSFAFAVATPVFLLADLQLRTIYVTDADERVGFGSYLGLRLLTTLAASAGLLGFALLRSDGSAALLAILGVAAAKAAESGSDVLYAVFQKRERMELVARSLLLRGLLGLAALAWVVASSRSVAAGAAALALVWLLVAVGHDLATAMRLSSAPVTRPRFDARTLGSLFRTALPLGVVTGLVALNFGIPRYFLEAFGGAAELGVFAAMSYCVIALGLIVNALGQSAVARLARLYSSGDGQGFRELMIRLVAFGAGLAAAALVVAYLAGSRILELLYGPEFAAQPTAFVLVVLGGSIGYVGSFLGYGMTAARRFRVQAPLFGALALLNAASCWLLVPRFGLRGAALATVVTALGGLVGSLAVNLRALRDLRS